MPHLLAVPVPDAKIVAKAVAVCPTCTERLVGKIELCKVEITPRMVAVALLKSRIGIGNPLAVYVCPPVVIRNTSICPSSYAARSSTYRNHGFVEDGGK